MGLFTSFCLNCYEGIGWFVNTEAINKNNGIKCKCGFLNSSDDLSDTLSLNREEVIMKRFTGKRFVIIEKSIQYNMEGYKLGLCNKKPIFPFKST